jgi:hypothetical protein
MALMVLVSGLFCSVVALIAFGIPSIRDVEKLIPDHDMGAASEEPKENKVEKEEVSDEQGEDVNKSSEID